MRIDQVIVSAIFILHIIFYIFVVIYIIRYKPKKASYSTIEPRFDTPLWRGTIIYLEDGQKSYNGKMDAIVYSESVFIGYADQGYPLLTISYVELINIKTFRDRVEISTLHPSSKETQKMILAGESRQIQHLTKKLRFLLKKGGRE